MINFSLAETAGKLLLSKKLFLATAESCTGGEVAQMITAIPGSSQWFERGFVTYSNAAKIEMLGVHDNTLATYGAVSEQVAKEMAEGALRHSHADCSLAITGIAGPEGGTVEKPVGLVCFAWTGKSFQTKAKSVKFSGDRLSVRDQATEYSVKVLLDFIGHLPE